MERRKQKRKPFYSNLIPHYSENCTVFYKARAKTRTKVVINFIMSFNNFPSSASLASLFCAHYYIFSPRNISLMPSLCSVWKFTFHFRIQYRETIPLHHIRFDEAILFSFISNAITFKFHFAMKMKGRLKNTWDYSHAKHIMGNSCELYESLRAYNSAEGG